MDAITLLGYLTKDLQQTQESPEAKVKYGYLGAILPPRLANQITDWVRKNIPNSVLGAGGRETTPHVTIKYGFIQSGPETLRAVQHYLSTVRPFPIKLLGVSLFKGNPDGDVLKIDVESQELRRLNREFSSRFRCHDKHPHYHPHLTLAYVDPRHSGMLVRRVPYFLPTEVMIDTLEFSTPEREKTHIHLSRGLKAMSYLNNLTGGALVGARVPERLQEKKRSKLLWERKALKSPQAGSRMHEEKQMSEEDVKASLIADVLASVLTPNPSGQKFLTGYLVKGYEEKKDSRGRRYCYDPDKKPSRIPCRVKDEAEKTGGGNQQTPQQQAPAQGAQGPAQDPTTQGQEAAQEAQQGAQEGPQDAPQGEQKQKRRYARRGSNKVTLDDARAKIAEVKAKIAELKGEPIPEELVNGLIQTLWDMTVVNLKALRKEVGARTAPRKPELIDKIKNVVAVPAEETPAEEPVAEPMAEETPTEETPTEETPEEVPAEEPVAEEVAEETPAEEVPVEETPAEPEPGSFEDDSDLTGEETEAAQTETPEAVEEVAPEATQTPEPTPEQSQETPQETPQEQIQEETQEQETPTAPREPRKLDRKEAAGLINKYGVGKPGANTPLHKEAPDVAILVDDIANAVADGERPAGKDVRKLMDVVEEAAYDPDGWGKLGNRETYEDLRDLVLTASKNRYEPTDPVEKSGEVTPRGETKPKGPVADRFATKATDIKPVDAARADEIAKKYGMRQGSKLRSRDTMMATAVEGLAQAVKQGGQANARLIEKVTEQLDAAARDETGYGVFGDQEAYEAIRDLAVQASGGAYEPVAPVEKSQPTTEERVDLQDDVFDEDVGDETEDIGSGNEKQDKLVREYSKREAEKEAELQRREQEAGIGSGTPEGREWLQYQHKGEKSPPQEASTIDAAAAKKLLKILRSNAETGIEPQTALGLRVMARQIAEGREVWDIGRKDLDNLIQQATDDPDGYGPLGNAEAYQAAIDLLHTATNGKYTGPEVSPDRPSPRVNKSESITAQKLDKRDTQKLRDKYEEGSDPRKTYESGLSPSGTNKYVARRMAALARAVQEGELPNNEVLNKVPRWIQEAADDPYGYGAFRTEENYQNAINLLHTATGGAYKGPEGIEKTPQKGSVEAARETTTEKPTTDTEALTPEDVQQQEVEQETATPSNETPKTASQNSQPRPTLNNASSTSPAAKKRLPDPQKDFPGFIRDIQSIADGLDRGWGPNKVYISDVYNALKEANPGLTPEYFKWALKVANQRGLLSLSRADLVQAMNPETVKASEINMSPGASAHESTGYGATTSHFILSSSTDRLQPKDIVDGEMYEQGRGNEKGSREDIASVYSEMQKKETQDTDKPRVEPNKSNLSRFRRNKVGEGGLKPPRIGSKQPATAQEATGGTQETTPEQQSQQPVGNEPVASEAVSKPTSPRSATKTTSKPSTSTVAKAFRDLDTENFNQVSLDKLLAKTGYTPEQLHGVVRDMVKRGLLTTQGPEGRHGLSPAEREAMIPPGDDFMQGVMYVSVPTGKEEEFTRTIKEGKETGPTKGDAVATSGEGVESFDWGSEGSAQPTRKTETPKRAVRDRETVTPKPPRIRKK